MRSSFGELFARLPGWTRPAPAALASCFVASALAALVVVLAMAVLGEYTKTRGRLLLTAIMMGGFFLTSLGPVALAQRRPGSVLARTGLATALTGITLLLVGVWGTPNSDGFWKTAGIIAVLAVALSYASVALWSVPVRPAPSVTARLSLAAFLTAATVVSVGIAWGTKDPTYWWVVVLLFLVWAVGALAVPAALWLLARWVLPGLRALGRD